MGGGTGTTSGTGSSAFGGSSTPNALSGNFQSGIGSLMGLLGGATYSPTAGINPTLPATSSPTTSTSTPGFTAAGAPSSGSNMGFGSYGSSASDFPQWLANILGYGGLFPGGPQQANTTPALDSSPATPSGVPSYIASSVNGLVGGQDQLFTPPAVPPPAQTGAAAPGAAAQPQSTYMPGHAPWDPGWAWGGPGSANKAAPAVAGMDPQMLANMSPATLKAILGGGWNQPGVQSSLAPFGQQASSLVQKWGAEGAPKDFYDYVNWRLGTAGMYGTPDAPSGGDPRTGWQQGYNSAWGNGSGAGGGFGEPGGFR